MEIANENQFTPPTQVSSQTPPVQTELPKKSRSKQVLLLIIVLVFVGIGAYYLYTQTNQAIKQPTSKASPTSALKSFTNAEYTFGLNYPSDWSLTENQSSNEFGKLYVLQFSPPGKDYIFYVTVLDNTSATRFGGNTSIQKEYAQWLSLPVQENLASPSASKKSGNIKIDSIDAVQFSTETDPANRQVNYGILTWVRKNNINYYIGIRADTSQTVQSASKIYSQILTSFKFTN